MRRIQDIPHPMCAKCWGPVAIFQVTQDVTTGELHVIARCHGETERVALSEYDRCLIDRATGLGPGFAFTGTNLITRGSK